MAHGDASGVNGSNRIMSHGAPLQRVMPNGCLGSPVLVLLFGLDRGFLMDVGPRRAGFSGLRERVEVTDAGSRPWHLVIGCPPAREPYTSQDALIEVRP